MSASRLASFTCIAITCNSSGRYGTSETNLENWLTRCACSASISLSDDTGSTSRLTCARKYGSRWVNSPNSIRANPCTSTRTL